MSSPTCPRCHSPLPEPPALQICTTCGQFVAATLTEAPADEDRNATRLFDPAEAVPTAAAPDRVGPYRLRRPLGSGGMGTVYEAEDAAGRRVAVKLISSGRVLSAEAVERFRREGRLASCITDPRCVFVLAADTDAGRPYLVMELMPGRTLTDLVQEQGPLAADEAVNKVLDVIAGLQAAHQQGVIHRDIKPSNCFLCLDGRVKVGDFGLAKTLLGPGEVDEEGTVPVSSDLELTQHGTFLGTVLFASPEQLRGEPLDFRSDVFAVSATLYYLLSGRPPFEGKTLSRVAARIAAGPPPALRAARPDLPAGIDRVVRRGLEHDPERRWRDLEALRVALLRFGPGRLSIGSLGLRVLAYAVDFLVVVALWFCLYWVLSFWWPALKFTEKTNLASPSQYTLNDFIPVTYLVSLLPELLYFGLLEGLWGYALGKWLFRLRVMRVGKNRPPGLVRALLRTLTLSLLLYLPLEIVRILPLDCLTKIVLGLLAWSKVGSLMLVASTMRERNGFRGAHEFVSGTCVLRLSWPGRSREAHVAGRLHGTDLLAVGLGWPAELPAQVGPFQVEGTLDWQDVGGVLMAQDVALGRKVLLWLRPGAPPLPPQRHEVNRLTRPRWLGGGVEGNYRWEAFVAPSGCSLGRLLASGPLPGWAQTRALLQQLTDELAAASADGTVPESLGPAQVWVQRGGQVQLLDMPLGSSAVAGQEEMPAQERALALLGQTARLLVQQPLPLHASTMLARLRAVDRPSDPAANAAGCYSRVEEFQADLAATRDRPTHVSRWGRALHLLVQAGLLLLGAVIACLLRGPLGWIVLGAAILWASAARGGPSFAVCGIALVRRDGRRASRWRAAWRALLTWAQGGLLLLLFVNVWLTFVVPRLDAGPKASNNYQEYGFCVFLGVLLVYTILVVWLPRRTLHDRLAGTYLVPE